MVENRDELIPTRWSLLQRLKDASDEQSWREFFATYRNLIYGVAMKSGLTEAEAEDAVQETVISVARKMPEFKADPAAGSFKNWLLLITRRRIADQFRKRPPMAETSAPQPDQTSRTSTVERIPDPAGIDLDAMWNAEWEKNLVAAAMEKVKRQVSLKQIQIYDLYVVQQWPVKKVTSTLGVNIGQVYLAKHRVSRLLRQEIKRIEKKML
ncbi:MAG: sigma-70 family RNA polymerase sigma factor [Verrucomicrobia bacterium]|nr:sigma-70 family RNA polymerase sigma factor [Verrucomicrobiota bacterium]